MTHYINLVLLPWFQTGNTNPILRCWNVYVSSSHPELSKKLSYNKICQNTFLWLVFSDVRIESKIISLHGEKKVSEKTRILACFTQQTFWCGKPRKNKNTESVLNLTFSHKSIFVISENTTETETKTEIVRYRDSPLRLICEKKPSRKKSQKSHSLQPVTLLEKGLPISCFLWILKKNSEQLFHRLPTFAHEIYISKCKRKYPAMIQKQPSKVSYEKRCS